MNTTIINLAEALKQCKTWVEVEGAIASNPNHKGAAWRMLSAEEKARIKALKENVTNAPLSELPPAPAQLREVEILCRRDNLRLRGYYYIGKKGDRVQLADRPDGSGFNGIFVDENEFEFVDGV